MMDEQEQKRKIEMQRELFSKAKVPGQANGAHAGSYSSSSSSPSGSSSGYQAFEDHDVDEDGLLSDLEGHHHGHGHHSGHHHVDTEEDKRQSEIFFSLLNGDEGEERKFSQEDMDQMVEFIMNQTDVRLIRFL